ncbi:hypothetical protein AB0K12_32870 [Nonomuraea sp. NPDC049419]
MTQATPLLMVGAGQVRSDAPWLPAQADSVADLVLVEALPAR